MKRISSLFPFATGCFILLFAGNALAIPRFSARYEQNCGLCHVNPSGGGQRTLYAQQFIVPAEMSMRAATPEELAQIDPQLSKNVSVGLDLRTMHHHADRRNVPYQNFLQMEGAIDLTFQPDPRFAAYVSRGLSTTYEAYGLLYVLPYNGYVKAGWFVPAFGWNFDDHTMFVRQKALSSSNSANDFDGAPTPENDVGIELATFPNRLALTFSILNGNPGSNIPDASLGPAYVAQAIYRLHVRGIGAGIGASFWRNEESQSVSPTWQYARTAGGPYGYLKYGKLIWLAESDWSRGVPAGDTTKAVSTMQVMSQELTYLLRRGIELRGTYDFFDPNTAVKSGARYRFGAGVEVIPTPFLDIQAMLNIHHFSGGADVTGQDFTQSQIQVHVFY